MTVINKHAEWVREIRREHGFEVYVLSTEKVEVAVVPELGARLMSLKDRRTGREWMWHPPGPLKLFRNGRGDDFSLSPLVGMDECLPTIAACSWRERRLADHGEVWSQPWQVDAEAWQQGVLQTSVRLRVSPFDFERSLRVRNHEILLRYRLANRAAAPEPFLWAMHPLLSLRPGDRLVLPPSTRALLNGETWLEAVDSAIPKGGCSKLFAGPLREGWTGIHNELSGERLEFEWNPAENDTLGLWLTRGGWHGCHHFAMEPGNGGPDALDAAVAARRCGVVAASGLTTWEIRLRVGH